MPTYAYTCKQCDAAFEQYQSFTDEPLRTCPSCGQDALRKVYSGIGGIQFRGSGFYCTDASTKSSAASASGTSSSDTSSSSRSD